MRFLSSVVVVVVVLSHTRMCPCMVVVLCMVSLPEHNLSHQVLRVFVLRLRLSRPQLLQCVKAVEGMAFELCLRRAVQAGDRGQGRRREVVISDALKTMTMTRRSAMAVGVMMAKMMARSCVWTIDYAQSLVGRK